MIRAVIQVAGPDRVAVITDAIAAAGCDDGAFRLGAVAIDVVSGVARVRETSTIAGSTATMDRLFRAVKGNAVELGRDSDAALAAAVQMTSATPGRALGLKRVGSLRQGYDANLVVLDRELQAHAVMVRGGWRVAD